MRDSGDVSDVSDVSPDDGDNDVDAGPGDRHLPLADLHHSCQPCKHLPYREIHQTNKKVRIFGLCPNYLLALPSHTYLGLNKLGRF